MSSASFPTISTQQLAVQSIARAASLTWGRTKRAIAPRLPNISENRYKFKATETSLIDTGTFRTRRANGESKVFHLSHVHCEGIKRDLTSFQVDVTDRRTNETSTRGISLRSDLPDLLAASWDLKDGNTADISVVGMGKVPADSYKDTAAKFPLEPIFAKIPLLK